MNVPGKADFLRAVRLGVVGAGGYAGVICRQLLTSPGDPMQLVCACEPDVERNGVMVARLKDAGVRVHRDLDDLLSDGIDAVWLPIPIDLHRAFAERAIEAGRAVMVEKPAAGCVEDVDAMIHARDKHRQLVAVGFQHLYDPELHQLQREIQDGIIGRVLAASVRVCWPRDEGYYQRTGWAGRLSRDGVWILDSPANNAMAHYIAMLLYLLSPGGQTVAEPAQIEAELYRVNGIENFDTCSLRIGLTDGVSILVLLTHACRQEQGPAIVIRGERGVIRMDGKLEIQNGVQTTRRSLATFDQLQCHMQERFVRRYHGQDVPIATLEMARAHTVAMNGASEAAEVHTIPPDAITNWPGCDGKTLHTIEGIERIFEQCQLQGKMLHESGLVPWSAPAGFRDLRGYSHFGGPKGSNAPQQVAGAASAAANSDGG